MVLKGTQALPADFCSYYAPPWGACAVAWWCFLLGVVFVLVAGSLISSPVCWFVSLVAINRRALALLGFLSSSAALLVFATV